MAMASLLDAGADLDEVVAGLGALPVRGWHIESEKATRAGVAATRLRVDVGPDEDGVDRTWADHPGTLESAPGLPERARRRAQKVFACLATAEGLVHAVSPEEVHFHEVGGQDALIDVVGTCLALESLGVASVYASPVAVGTGTVRGAHGVLPNPAPAVVRLLAGAPVHGTGQNVELTTPTGAALLAGLAASFGPLPLHEGDGRRLRRRGPGDSRAGRTCCRSSWERKGSPGDGQRGYDQDLVVLEANVDDVTGEVLAHTVEALCWLPALSTPGWSPCWPKRAGPAMWSVPWPNLNAWPSWPGPSPGRRGPSAFVATTSPRERLAREEVEVWSRARSCT